MGVPMSAVISPLLQRQGATGVVPAQRPMPWIARLRLVLGMSLLVMLLILAPILVVVHGFLR